MKTLLLFVFLLFSSSEGFSFNYVLRNFDVDHGLPSSETYRVFQDSKGYIWIATDAGVSRYDGYKFTNFTSHEGLSDNTVFGFYEDKKGRIWFRTFSGELSYYLNGTIYRPFAHFEKKNVFNGDIQISLHEEGDTLWIGGQKNLFQVYIPTGYVKRIETGLHYYVKEFGNGKYVYGRDSESDDSFGIINNSGKVSIPHGYTLFRRSLSYIRLSVEPDKHGNYFFSEGYDVYTVNHSKVQKLNLPIGNKGNLFLHSENNFLWVGILNGGVIRVDLKTNDTLHLLNNLSVSGMLIDKAGGYWFTTTEKGIFYLNNFHVKSLIIPGTYSSNVQALASGKEGIFIGLSEGLYKYDSEKKNIKKTHDEFVRSICYKKGEIFIGTASQNTYAFDAVNNKIRSVRQLPNVINIVTDNGNIYYQNHSQVGIIDQDFISSILIPRRPHCVAILAADSLIVGTRYGVYVTGKLNGVQRIFDDELNLRCRIEDIKTAKNGTIYFATRGNGLVVFRKGKFIRIGKQQGLKSDICHKILLAENGNIYVGTNNGISIIKGDDLHPIGFISTAQGLISADVQCLTEFNGLIYAGTSKGLSLFPSDFVPSTTLAPFFVETIQLSDSIIHETESITVPPAENFFSIHFVALRFDNADEVRKNLL